MMRGLLVVTVLAALTLALREVRAAPLDAATCGQIRGEQVQLEEGGVRGNMAKGPEWAKANLAADKLQQIRRLMELDELVLFRCSGRNLVDLPPDADADPAASAPEANEGGKEATSKAKAAKNSPTSPAKSSAAKAKPDAAPTKGKADLAKKQHPTKSVGTPPAGENAAAAKPKPKAKVDDAYKPPPSNPNTDPFANQPPRQ